jgi:hypothetical protein
LLTAFGSGSSSPTQMRPASANRFLPAGQPRPQVVSLRGSLRLQLPIAQSRLTAIGYHAVGGGALSLEPVGQQRNEGLLQRIASKLFGGSERGLSYYMLGGASGSSTASLDVGAAPGTDVYSPVDGTIVGIRPYVLDGSPHGSVLQIQPTSTPADIVTLTNIRTASQIAVGDQVIAARTRLGTVIDLSRVITQELAKYTSDAGNHVHLEVGPAPAASLLL